MLEPQERIRFEQLVLPHLDAAMNLARWLVRNRPDAEDVVQESMLRAYRFFDHFRGGDARAWLLQIIRNSCYSWLEKNRPSELMTEFDEEIHQRPGTSPETLALQANERVRVVAMRLECHAGKGRTLNPLITDTTQRLSSTSPIIGLKICSCDRKGSAPPSAVA